MHNSTPSKRLTAEFTTFMRAYQDMVFSTAARLTGDRAQAEDIAQDVFIKAYQSFDMLRDSPSPGGWLKTVARNLTLNHLSRHRSRWRFFSDLTHNASEDGDNDLELNLPGLTTPDDLFAGVHDQERRELVEQALKKLPQHQRVPLVLYHFEDMPYQEIAQHLRISLPKVKTDILRARTALAKILATLGEAREAITE
ncbi:MAG: sigma-70 family RNA polymerase sigma factor [Gammaproteobacteria bacterium]